MQSKVLGVLANHLHVGSLIEAKRLHVSVVSDRRPQVGEGLFDRAHRGQIRGLPRTGGARQMRLGGSGQGARLPKRLAAGEAEAGERPGGGQRLQRRTGQRGAAHEVL